MTVLIPGLYGLDSTAAWKNFTKDPQKYLDRFAKDKSVVKEIDYFSKKAPTFESVDALFKDRKALQYLLDAYGLGSEINNAGRLKKILTEDPTNENSLVNKLADSRFKAMADNLRLDQNMDKLKRLSFLDVLKDKYVQNEFEENLGEQDPSLRQAAYFARSAGSISDVYAVLGNSILRDVVQTTFSIPAQLAIQPVESQAAALTRRVDFTKFTGITSNANVTQSQLTRAKSDFTLLQTNLAISDKAVAQMTTLQSQLNQLVTDYTNLTPNTDPGGANAATIALQQVAVPELIRFEELLNKGKEITDASLTNIDYLNDFIVQAQNPTADLNALKSQFSAFVSIINTAIDNTTITAPDGSSQNVLMNGSADTISVTLDDIGTTVTINRYNAQAIKDSLTTADASFNAIVDSNDTANIFAAQGRVLIAGDAINAIKDTIATDLEDFNTTVGAEPFYATLNTVSLQQGYNSVTDSLSRLTKIEELIEKIGDLATESKNRDSVDDRSDLITEFDAARAELRSLIENPTAVGYDNFLNNIGNQSYEISSGFNIPVAGGYDLAATVADILDAGSLADQTSAQALESSAITVTISTDTARAGLESSEPYLDRAINKYDPHGSLDNQIYKLKADLADFIAGAATEDGKNLLSPDQSDINLDLSTGISVKLRAQRTFQSTFNTDLDAIITALGTGDNNAVLTALNDALYVVDSTKRSLSSDNRYGTLEMGKLGGLIDTLEPQDTSNTENPYKMNAFTEKFLQRYLMQVNMNNGGSTASGPNSYVLSLFGSGSNGDSSSALSSIMSLSMKV